MNKIGLKIKFNWESQTINWNSVDLIDSNSVIEF